jgi:Ca2+-binding RTX toxin-like protein
LWTDSNGEEDSFTSIEKFYSSNFDDSIFMEGYSLQPDWYTLDGNDIVYMTGLTDPSINIDGGDGYDSVYIWGYSSSDFTESTLGNQTTLTGVGAVTTVVSLTDIEDINFVNLSSPFVGVHAGSDRTPNNTWHKLDYINYPYNDVAETHTTFAPTAASYESSASQEFSAKNIQASLASGEIIVNIYDFVGVPRVDENSGVYASAVLNDRIMLENDGAGSSDFTEFTVKISIATGGYFGFEVHNSETYLLPPGLGHLFDLASISGSSYVLQEEVSNGVWVSVDSGVNISSHTNNLGFNVIPGETETVIEKTYRFQGEAVEFDLFFGVNALGGAFNSPYAYPDYADGDTEVHSGYSLLDLDVIFSTEVELSSQSGVFQTQESNYAPEIIGGVFGDNIRGGLLDENISSYDGDDNVDGGDGNDSIYGGAGNDTLSGGSGSNLLTDDSGDETYIYAGGMDTIVDSAGSDIIQMGTGIILADLSFHREGLHAFISVAGSGAIKIDQYFAAVQNRIETVRFADNSTLILSSSNFLNVINGNASNNFLNGTSGDDLIDGNAGADNIYGNAGNDILYGGDGDDGLNGGQGADILYGQGDYDFLYGEDGADFLDGGDSYDWLYGGADDDQLYGGNDDDFLSGGSGNDTLDGGAGIDTASYEQNNAAVKVNLAAGAVDEGRDGTNNETLTGIENVVGTLYGDWLLGDTGANQLSGGEGNDELEGNNGEDTLYGGDGDDVLVGGEGSDMLSGDAGNDQLEGGDGEDYLAGGDGDDIGFGGAGNDVLSGDDGNDVLFGNEDNDWLSGYAGNDRLVGGSGNDILNGGDGDDTNAGGATGGLEGGTGNDILFGGTGDDVLAGNEDDDILYGEDGFDTLIGGSGADTFAFTYLFGGTGIDTIQDFSLSDGDKLNLSELLSLSEFDPLTDLITDFVEITTSGSNSILKVDLDGGGNSFVQIAQLSNVTGLTDEAALYNAGTLIAA